MLTCSQEKHSTQISICIITHSLKHTQSSVQTINGHHSTRKRTYKSTHTRTHRTSFSEAEQSSSGAGGGDRGGDMEATPAKAGQRDRGLLPTSHNTIINAALRPSAREIHTVSHVCLQPEEPFLL